ncbi:Dimodular nonribosomal peptide synthase [Bordetella ansorpii]|uniref:Dimodular nonribosomal peptide synthase n=1 Tax=Bordetella ansorpii TaxID=288768 RepID=A0A157QWW7_9BORD|nr:MbtH family protein [Bordetella ansorpii]SAI50197.1 Dimodular nonribosomal peptide synthase [Bordetella ansorpii]
MSIDGFDREDGIFVVLVNDDGQYSIWPHRTPAPAGWRVVEGIAGDRPTVLTYLEQACLRHGGGRAADAASPSSPPPSIPPTLPAGLELLGLLVPGSLPLFCLHPVTGSVLDYHALADQLRAERTVYGLACRMLADARHTDVSLAQMADDYTAAIRCVQPQGPYHLLGWALGGALAVMVCARLEQTGQAIRFLGLVDPFVPAGPQGRPRDWQQDFRAFVSMLGAAEEDIGVLRGPSAQQMAHEAIAELLQPILVRSSQPPHETRDAAAAATASREVAKAFFVARHLKRLADEASPLPELRIRPLCWWTGRSGHSARQALKSQLQADEWAFEIDAMHGTMLTHPSVLQAIRRALAGR